MSKADVCQTAHQVDFQQIKGSRLQQCSIRNCAEEQYHQQDDFKFYIPWLWLCRVLVGSKLESIPRPSN